MDIEDFYNWENKSISNIIYLMVKCFNFDSVKMDVTYRKDVPSGVWWEVSFEKEGKKYYTNGQRTEIVKRRLISQLDSLDIRKDYLDNQTPTQ